MKFKKTACYLVDLHYYGDASVDPITGHSHEITYKDVIIPCDVLNFVVEDEINECDIIIKAKSLIYLPNEC